MPNNSQETSPFKIIRNKNITKYLLNIDLLQSVSEFLYKQNEFLMNSNVYILEILNDTHIYKQINSIYEFDKSSSTIYSTCTLQYSIQNVLLCYTYRLDNNYVVVMVLNGEVSDNTLTFELITCLDEILLERV